MLNVSLAKVDGEMLRSRMSYPILTIELMIAKLTKLFALIEARIARSLIIFLCTALVVQTLIPGRMWFNSS